jgi:Group II intron, maturase-specific domain
MIAHIDEGSISWASASSGDARGDRTSGSSYTWPSNKALASVKAKVRAITRGGTNQPLAVVLRRLNPVLRGWANYFRHAVSKATFDYLGAFSWRRVICWLRHKHRRANWKWLRRRYLPGWRPTDGEVTLFNPDGGRGYPLALPGRTDPHALDHSGGNCRIAQRHGLAESRMRGNAHVRFGRAGRGNGCFERTTPRPGPILTSRL